MLFTKCARDSASKSGGPILFFTSDTIFSRCTLFNTRNVKTTNMVERCYRTTPIYRSTLSRHIAYIIEFRSGITNGTYRSYYIYSRQLKQIIYTIVSNVINRSGEIVEMRKGQKNNPSVSILYYSEIVNSYLKENNGRIATRKPTSRLKNIKADWLIFCDNGLLFQLQSQYLVQVIAQ